MLPIGGARACSRVARRRFVAASSPACNGRQRSRQPTPVKRVGLMHVGTDHVPPSWPALKARLEELGWSNGKNIELIWRNLEPDAADAQANEFVAPARGRHRRLRGHVDRRRPGGDREDEGSRSPIVFLHPSDPVRDGLVESLSHPGGNLTGVFGARDVVAKQLELYQLLVPKLRRVLTLVDPTDPRTKRLLPQYQAAAAQLHDRSSWTFGSLDRRRTSSASSDRCGPARSTARSSCRRASGSTSRR